MSFLVSNTVILLYCNGVGGIILFEYSTSVVDSLSPVLHLYCVLRSMVLYVPSCRGGIGFISTYMVIQDASHLSVIIEVCKCVVCSS